MLTKERLKELLDYNETTGIFTWKVDKGYRIKAGDVAGCISRDGWYTHLGIDGKLYKAHRLVWLYVHGIWPTNNIDHINQKKWDNRLVNLRDVTYTENSRNTPLYKRNKSGHVGVHWCKRDKRWYAGIRIKGKQLNLGCFINKEDAIKCRQAANIKYDFSPNHGKNNLKGVS